MDERNLDETAVIPDDLPEDATLTYRPPGDARGETETATAGMTQWGTGKPEAVPVDSPQKKPMFHLREQIGEGGMGEVWEALQVSLERVVAVKRIHQSAFDEGSKSDQLDRKKRLFRDEALIAARLEHPNIVPVHDFGTDDSGNLMLAMKRVEGRAWDDVIADDWSELATQEFLDKHLAILVSVAQAVSFAHSHKIIHRDLKPAQVMVGEFGEVLLMDWGLALFVGDPAELAEQPQSTGIPTRETANCPSGTPAMMAPEQTHRDGKMLNTWTDIYLLGGILYLILTGKYPHEARNAREAVRRAMRGVVEPPQARAPERLIPAELSTICMRCLDPEPENRPASADEVSEAIHDYTTGRSRRLESIKIAHHAKYELDQNPRDYAEITEIQHQISRALVLWSLNPEVPILRDRSLVSHAEMAMRNGDLKLARVQASSIECKHARAEILQQVASAETRQIRRERQRVAAVVAVFALLLVVVLGSAFFNRRLRSERDVANNQRIRAEDSRDRALGLIKFMYEDQADELEAHGHLGLLRQNADEVVNFFEELPEEDFTSSVLVAHAASVNNLGVIEAKEGNNDLALIHFRAAKQKFDGLREDPEVRDEALAGSLSAVTNMAEALRIGGQIDEAEQLLRSVREDPAFAELISGPTPSGALHRLDVDNQLYHLYAAMGRDEEAARILDATLAELKPVIDEHPGELDLLRLYVKNMEERTYVDMNLGEGERAATRLGEAAEYWERLVAESPGDARVKVGLASNRRHLGNIFSDRGELETALEHYARSEQINRALVEADPLNSNHQAQLAVLLQRISQAHLRSGNYELALEHGNSMVDLLASLSGVDTGNERLKSQLGWAYETVGDIHLQMEEYDRAIERFGLARGVYDGLVEEQPKNPYPRYLAANLSILSGDASRLAGDPAVTFNYLADARNRLAAIDQAFFEDPHALLEKAAVNRMMGDAAALSGNPSAARVHLEDAKEVLSRIKAEGGLIPEIDVELALAELGESLAMNADGDVAAAAAKCAAVIETLAGLYAAYPEDQGAAFALARAKVVLGRLGEGSEASLEEAVSLLDDLIEADNTIEYRSLREEALRLLGGGE